MSRELAERAELTKLNDATEGWTTLRALWLDSTRVVAGGIASIVLRHEL
jgi:hypothetical protein